MSNNIASSTNTKKDYASHLNQRLKNRPQPKDRPKEEFSSLIIQTDFESFRTSSQVATSSAISDQLFIEMCDRGPMIDDPGNLSRLTGLATRQINWYYLESALYAARISVGDFSAPKAQRPVFKLKMNHFSPGLQWHLRTSKESLNEIITDAAFTLFRARHTLAFYKYIEPQRKKFRWSLD
jgi:hypothetical protein